MIARVRRTMQSATRTFAAALFVSCIALLTIAPACGRSTGACVETHKGTSLTGPYTACSVKMERECQMDALHASPPTFYKEQSCKSVGYPCKDKYGANWPLAEPKKKDPLPPLPDFGPCGSQATLEP